MSLHKSPREIEVWQLISFGKYNLTLKSPTQLQLYSNIFCSYLAFSQCCHLCLISIPVSLCGLLCLVCCINLNYSFLHHPSQELSSQWWWWTFQGPEHDQQNIFAHWSKWSIKRISILFISSGCTKISHPSFWARNSSISAKIELEQLHTISIEFSMFSVINAAFFFQTSDGGWHVPYPSAGDFRKTRNI